MMENWEKKRNGMLECWNNGKGRKKRSNGILECWNDGIAEKKAGILEIMEKWNIGERRKPE
jgi:hypothetical protein